MAIRCCRIGILHCITSVQGSYFGDIGRYRFQLFLVDTGTVSTRKEGSQRLVSVKSQEKVIPIYLHSDIAISEDYFDLKLSSFDG